MLKELNLTPAVFSIMVISILSNLGEITRPVAIRSDFGASFQLITNRAVRAVQPSGNSSVGVFLIVVRLDQTTILDC